MDYSTNPIKVRLARSSTSLNRFLYREAGNYVEQTVTYTNLENIFTSSRRVPLTSFERQVLSTYLETAIRNGLDIKLDITAEDQVEGMLSDGAILLKSGLLERSFLLVKIDAGRGFFGAQKTHVLTFIGHSYKDEFQAGPSLKSIAVALTSINNIFRGVGALRGPAL